MPPATFSTYYHGTITACRFNCMFFVRTIYARCDIVSNSKTIGLRFTEKHENSFHSCIIQKHMVMPACPHWIPGSQGLIEMCKRCALEILASIGVHLSYQDCVLFVHNTIHSLKAMLNLTL